MSTEETAQEELGFEVNVETLDRDALLREALGEVQMIALQCGGDGGAGGGFESFSDSPAVDTPAVFVDINQDKAEPAVPVVYPINDKDFIAKIKPVPVQLADAQRRHAYYWIEIPIFLKHKSHLAFERMEVEVVLGVDGGPEKQPSAHEVYPQHVFQELAKAGTRMTVQLDEKLQFKTHAEAGADLGAAGAEGEGSANLTYDAGASFVAGPFNYVIRKARIKHAGVGTNRVFWRIDGADYLEEGSPRLVVVARVPTAAKKQVKAHVTVQAYRYMPFLSADVGVFIKSLPERLAMFFKAGAPVWGRATIDLSALL